MKNYYRIMLGKKSLYAQEAYEGSFIGASWLEGEDLTGKLPESMREFNSKFIPIYHSQLPDKPKVAAGLACGMLYTITKGINVGDMVLCPDGHTNYYVGEVTGDYKYHKGATLPHRRPVRWNTQIVKRAEMSEPLRNSTGAIGTVSDISKHATEIEALMSSSIPTRIFPIDVTIEDPVTFALEKHLEDFLVGNWSHTELGKHYDIYEEDGEKVGQQYISDTGPIDVLAISKDKKEILVVELKRGRVSDVVVGQVLRYMGYVMDELAEENQSVRGVIIALEDDKRLRRALSATTNIDFYTYEVSFKLEKK